MDTYLHRNLGLWSFFERREDGFRMRRVSQKCQPNPNGQGMADGEVADCYQSP